MLKLLDNDEIAIDSIKYIIDNEIAKQADQVNSMFNVMSGSLKSIDEKIIVPIAQARETLTKKIIPFLELKKCLQKYKEVVSFLSNTLSVALSLIDTSISTLQFNSLNTVNKGVNNISKNTLALSSSLTFSIIMETSNGIGCGKKYFQPILENGVEAVSSIRNCAEGGLERLNENLSVSFNLARSMNEMMGDLWVDLNKCSDNLINDCISKVNIL